MPLVLAPAGFREQMGGLAVSSTAMSSHLSQVFLLSRYTLDNDRKPFKGVRIRARVLNKPRKFSLPVLILCIVLRIEVFHRVSQDLQCSSPGIEVSPIQTRSFSFQFSNIQGGFSGIFSFTSGRLRISIIPKATI